MLWHHTTLCLFILLLISQLGPWRAPVLFWVFGGTFLGWPGFSRRSRVQADIDEQFFSFCLRPVRKTKKEKTNTAVEVIRTPAGGGWNPNEGKPGCWFDFPVVPEPERRPRIWPKRSCLCSEGPTSGPEIKPDKIRVDLSAYWPAFYQQQLEVIIRLTLSDAHIAVEEFWPTLLYIFVSSWRAPERPLKMLFSQCLLLCDPVWYDLQLWVDSRTL